MSETPPEGQQPGASRARTADVEFIRRKFKQLGVEEAIAGGRLREVIRISRPPRRDYGLPAGTLSQIVAVVDAEGTQVAEYHRYLLPDGSIGASGLLDPKGIRVGGTYYRTL